MKGNVLGYDAAAQVTVVRGEDGRRYGFATTEWREQRPPRKRDTVDFEPDGPRARAVFLVEPATGAAADAATTPAEALAAWPAARFFLDRPVFSASLLVLLACLVGAYSIGDLRITVLEVPELISRMSEALNSLVSVSGSDPTPRLGAGLARVLLVLLLGLYAVPVLAGMTLWREFTGRPDLRIARIAGIATMVLPILLPLLVILVVQAWVLPGLNDAGTRLGRTGVTTPQQVFEVLRLYSTGTVLLVAAGAILWVTAGGGSRLLRRGGRPATAGSRDAAASASAVAAGSGGAAAGSAADAFAPSAQARPASRSPFRRAAKPTPQQPEPQVAADARGGTQPSPSASPSAAPVDPLQALAESAAGRRPAPRPQPASAQPASAQPSSAQPSSAQPPSAQPAPPHPAPVQPAAARPAPAQSGAAQPAATQSAAAPSGPAPSNPAGAPPQEPATGMRPQSDRRDAPAERRDPVSALAAAMTAAESLRATGQHSGGQPPVSQPAVSLSGSRQPAGPPSAAPTPPGPQPAPSASGPAPDAPAGNAAPERSDDPLEQLAGTIREAMSREPPPQGAGDAGTASRPTVPPDPAPRVTLRSSPPAQEAPPAAPPTDAEARANAAGAGPADMSQQDGDAVSPSEDVPLDELPPRPGSVWPETAAWPSDRANPNGGPVGGSAGTPRGERGDGEPAAGEGASPGDDRS